MRIICAGLFDRAETLFQELVEQPDHTAVALSRLIYIFQQEKDWRQAIAYCDRLERLGGLSRRRETAHYCCELAEEASQRQDEASAQASLQEALSRDPGCARASLLQGRLAMRAGDYPAAMTALQAVEWQDRGFFPEAIALLSQCYSALGRLDEWLVYLRAAHSQDHSGRVTDAVAEWLLKLEGEDAALRFLESELRDYPTLLGLRRLVEIAGPWSGRRVCGPARSALHQHAVAEQRRALSLCALRFLRCQDPALKAGLSLLLREHHQAHS